MVIVGDDSGVGFVRLICGLVSATTNSQPSEEGFHEDREEEGGECVLLKGASIYGKWDGVTTEDHVVDARSGVELLAGCYV